MSKWPSYCTICYLLSKRYINGNGHGLWGVKYCKKVCLINVHYILVYHHTCFYSINSVIHGRCTVLQPLCKMYTSFCMPFLTCFCWTNSDIQGHFTLPQPSLFFNQAQRLGVAVLLTKEPNHKQSSIGVMHHHCCVADTLCAVTFVRTIPNSNNPFYYIVPVRILSIEQPEQIILPVSETWFSMWLQTYLHVV